MTTNALRKKHMDRLLKCAWIMRIFSVPYKYSQKVLPQREPLNNHVGKIARSVGIHGMKWITFLYINLFPLLIELLLTLTFSASYSLLYLLSYTWLLCRRSLFHCKKNAKSGLVLIGFSYELTTYSIIQKVFPK